MEDGEYIIYCDESDKNGKFFSNFYGGALIHSQHLEDVVATLQLKKSALNLHGEVKWQKITFNYQEKYSELMNCFFDFIKDGKIKIRIMFTHNAFIPASLTKEQKDNEYFLLYYQFVKHIFGLQYIEGKHRKRFRIYFDELPDSKEKCLKFKAQIANLNNFPQFINNNVLIDENQIAEVCSDDHVILQCLDIILGSIVFRLNDKHKEKPKGQRIRGKRTRAKEEIFKIISKRIREIYPNFNIGDTTGTQGEKSNHWQHRYRHWKFISQDHVYDKTQGKRHP